MNVVASSSTNDRHPLHWTSENISPNGQQLQLQQQQQARRHRAHRQRRYSSSIMPTSFRSSFYLVGMTLLVFACLISQQPSLFVSANTDPDFGLCCLCDRCFLPVDGRGNMVVRANGDTCDAIALQMASMNPNRPVCQTYKDDFRSDCCDPNITPIPVVPPVVEPQVITMKFGKEEYCDICKSGDFPGRPETVTAILYMEGNPTCKELYFMGRSHNIPTRLCNPIRGYFQEPCGCDQYHPRWNPPAEGDTVPEYGGPSSYDPVYIIKRKKMNRRMNRRMNRNRNNKNRNNN